MSTRFEIPLIPSAQRFTVTLVNVDYQMRVTWNAKAACWVLDIYDADGTALLSGAPLVTGVDLLEQYAYLGIPGQLIVQSDPDPDDVPTYDGLGSTGHLYYLAPT